MQVSVVIATFNSSSFILDALNSIEAQSYKEIELIITDDCSTDQTIKFCEDWISKRIFRFTNYKILKSKTNTGISANLNRAIRHCTSKWIFFCAGDDAIYNKAIENYVNYINKNNHIMFLHGLTNKFLNEFSREYLVANSKQKNYLFNNKDITAKKQFEILLRVKLSINGVFINKGVFEKVGMFDEKFTIWEDKPFYLKVLKNNIKIYFYDSEPIYKYRIRNNSITREKRENIISQWTINRDDLFIKNYSKHLGTLEKAVIILENNRKKLLVKLGLIERTKLNIIINFLSGFIFNKYTNYVTKKYK